MRRRDDFVKKCEYLSIYFIFFLEGEGVGFGGMNHIEGPVIIHRRILVVSQLHLMHPP